MQDNSICKNILITGAAGFIGCNFVHYLLEDLTISDINLIILDNLSYSGNLENLAFAEKYSNYRFIKGDICDSELLEKIFSEYKIDGVINFAAESHVDRSIISSLPFLNSNVVGTVALLDASKKYGIRKYLQISTDEVYGSLGDEGSFNELSQIKPNSPYSASKASADHFAISYYKTHKMPIVITRCSNNYGPNQFPEKLIPLMILNALENKALPVYGDGLNVRDWIYVSDHCSAVWTVFNNGKNGEVYNIGGNSELTNLQVVKTILQKLGKDESLITYVADRPGHDRRYAMDINKINTELGWSPAVSFELGFKKTVNWYLDNLDWCSKIRSGEYLNYYKEQYGKEL